jgi:hypothetical protein
MLTSVVAEFTGPSWLLRTSVVFAPEQAVNENEDTVCVEYQRYGYPFVLRRQLPLELM